MKTVFPNSSMVAHVWAQRSQQSGRNSTNNIHFDGDVLYSYSTPIARFAWNKKETALCVLLCEDQYSMTTAGHKSDVRSAVRHSQRPLFIVPHVYYPTENPKAMREERDRLIREIATARNKVSRAKRFGAAESYVSRCNEYLAFMGERKLKDIPTNETIEREHASYVKAEKTRKAKMEKRHKEESRIAALESAERLALWAAGEDVRLLWTDRVSGDMMRVKGDQVETTRGAFVPLAHVQRIARIVLPMIANGTAWTSNGKTLHVGHFTIDRIESDGTVYAGCHYFTRTEIERFASVLASLPEASEIVASDPSLAASSEV